MPEYYTYKNQVPLRPGEKLGFTTGRGYYAILAPARLASAPRPHPVQPTPSGTPIPAAPTSTPGAAPDTPPATTHPVQPTPAATQVPPSASGTTGAPAAVGVPHGRLVALPTRAQHNLAPSSRALQGAHGRSDTLDPSQIGHVLGHGQAPIFEKPTGYVVVKLSEPLQVTRIFGGNAPKVGSIFLHEPAPTAATSDEAKRYLGSAREPGNTAALKAYATIPAGTIVLVGLSAPGRTPTATVGGKIIVQLADAADAQRVRFGHDFHLPDNPGSPFGDGPGLMLQPVGPH